MLNFFAPLTPRFYIRLIEGMLLRRRLRLNPSLLGVEKIPAGHFYSPLLDLRLLPTEGDTMPFDGPEYWEAMDLRREQMEAYYRELAQVFPAPHFPPELTSGFRYFRSNGFYPFADAFTLAAIMRREKPRRIIEVGSGFSTAAMVDTIQHAGLSTEVTCIEPYPERLYSTIRPGELPFVRVLEQRVQEVAVTLFDQLEAGDILFIDSSHVAKIGSDVTYLLLRVLPRLRPGVLVHFHDIFYPYSYPMVWLRDGRAWNESLFVRAMLVNNPTWQVIAFNAFAGGAFPDVFQTEVPGFLGNTGGCLWLRKLS